jgi:hypothetical protein
MIVFPPAKIIDRQASRLRELEGVVVDNLELLLEIKDGHYAAGGGLYFLSLKGESWSFLVASHGMAV